MSVLLEHLDYLISLTGGKQAEYYKFIKDNGVLFTSMNVEESKKACEVYSPEIKGCYVNSYNINQKLGLDYYSGFYTFDDFPIAIEHAFNVNSKGEVIDITATLLKVTPTEWFGVKISKDTLSKFLYFDEWLRKEFELKTKGAE